MTTGWEEKQILYDVVDGLNAAIDAQEWDSEKLDPIKFNKLLFKAVKAFDLPVTYRWYKYGTEFTKHGVKVDEATGRGLVELPSPDEPRIEDPSNPLLDDLPSPARYKEFFEHEVADIDRLFRDETKDYLRTFYDDVATDNLSDVYSSCAVLQRSLDHIGHADDPGAAVSDVMPEIIDEIKALVRALMFCEDVADVDEKFKGYSDFLQDVLVTVTDERNGELRPRQNEMLRETIRFFYEEAWEIVALKIAIENTEGPNEFVWRKDAANRFSHLVDDYPRALQLLTRETAHAGLVSDALRDYMEPRSRKANAERQLELEERVAKEWGGVSKEANRHL